MNLPSRGLRESATTMRYVGCFLRPVRRRRMRTAMVVLLLGFRAALGSSRAGEIPAAPNGGRRDGRMEGWRDARNSFPPSILPSLHPSFLLSHSKHVRPELARIPCHFLHHLLHVAE